MVWMLVPRNSAGEYSVYHIAPFFALTHDEFGILFYPESVGFTTCDLVLRKEIGLQRKMNSSSCYTPDMATVGTRLQVKCKDAQKTH